MHAVHISHYYYVILLFVSLLSFLSLLFYTRDLLSCFILITIIHRIRENIVFVLPTYCRQPRVACAQYIFIVPSLCSIVVIVLHAFYTFAELQLYLREKVK